MSEEMKVNFNEFKKVNCEAYKNSKRINSITTESKKCPKCKCKSIYVQFTYPIISYWVCEDWWDIHIMMEYECKKGSRGIGNKVKCLCAYCNHDWESSYSIEYAK